MQNLTSEILHAFILDISTIFDKMKDFVYFITFVAFIFLSSVTFAQNTDGNSADTVNQQKIQIPALPDTNNHDTTENKGKIKSENTITDTIQNKPDSVLTKAFVQSNPEDFIIQRWLFQDINYRFHFI